MRFLWGVRLARRTTEMAPAELRRQSVSQHVESQPAAQCRESGPLLEESIAPSGNSDVRCQSSFVGDFVRDGGDIVFLREGYASHYGVCGGDECVEGHSSGDKDIGRCDRGRDWEIIQIKDKDLPWADNY